MYGVPEFGAKETKEFEEKLNSITQELSTSTYKAIKELLRYSHSLEDYIQLTIQRPLNFIYNKVFRIKCQHSNGDACTSLEILMDEIEQIATEYGVRLEFTKEAD